jgi:hypothetical protein
VSFEVSAVFFVSFCPTVVAVKSTFVVVVVPLPLVELLVVVVVDFGDFPFVVLGPPVEFAEFPCVVDEGPCVDGP